MRLLLLGDVVGEAGLVALERQLPSLRERLCADFVVVNGENASFGAGLFVRDYRRILGAGADCVTLGNHWKAKPDILDWMEDADRLVRPRNLLGDPPGVGSLEFVPPLEGGRSLVVTNLLGTAFMREQVVDPWQSFLEAVDEFPDSIHIVDYHAESTSEKKLFAYQALGRASVVVGTHTHVKTDDAQVIRERTAFLTDLGLCGDESGVIGFDPERSLKKVREGDPSPFLPLIGAEAVLEGLLVELDDWTGVPLYLEDVKARCRIDG